MKKSFILKAITLTLFMCIVFTNNTLVAGGREVCAAAPETQLTSGPTEILTNHTIKRSWRVKTAKEEELFAVLLVVGIISLIALVISLSVGPEILAIISGLALIICVFSMSLIFLKWWAESWG